jgi:peptidoglycan/xylan/chitin deacetylase (PgdA/CDA1 family)
MYKKAFPILMYHSIASKPKGTKMRSLHVNPKRFSFQMKMLKFFGYRGICMTELKPYLMGDKSGKVVGLTFDDGYQNNLSNALPILKKLGFTATLYLVSEKLGGVNDWDTKRGLPENRLMDIKEIEEWIGNGMEIGSHTENHINLIDCNNKIAFNEINQSKINLEKTFKIKVAHFCYPYGNFDNRLLSIVKKVGYETATSTLRGRSSVDDPILALPRVKITHHTLPHLFLLKLFSKYEDKTN